MNTPRSYTMTARARSVEQTRERILAATLHLHGQRFSSDIGLDHIADRAGVSVQTVLRHFGSRARLLEASIAWEQQAVAEERQTPVGDVGAALRVLVDHYEARGDSVLMMLAQERTEELARRVTDAGRQLHRQWVGDVFAPHLSSHPDPELLADLLVVATDVYAWKLLRRDRGLSRQRTEARLARLVRAVLAHPNDPETTP